jgi:cell division protein FtsI (penicillin-binding protein 3)
MASAAIGRARPLEKTVEPSARAQSSTGIAYDRLMLVLLLFAGAIFLIAARLAQLQLTSSDSNVVAPAAGIPARAEVVDRNGIVLATTIDAWTVGVQPANVIGDKVELAAQLNELMPEQSAEWYLRQLNSQERFVYLRRGAGPELVQAVNALGEPGLTFARATERLYPQGAMAGHILGWVDRSGHGGAGIERSLEDQLFAQSGTGQPLALSIDSRVQAALEDELDKSIQRLSAEGGSGIVMDVDTGEVIAMASGPGFNPNVPGEAPEIALRNNATLGAYELGSAFKPLTMAAALDAGVTTPQQRWDSSPVPIGRFHISDSHPVGRALTIPEVLTHSSNTATARIADAMGPERMNALFRSLHFNERMPIELRERAGTLYPHEWARSTVMTTGFGHGIAVTPLHLATAYAALVNGGIWRPATLLKRDRPPPVGERVFSADTSFKIRQMLRLIVTDGTGRNANAEGYRVGGKTGTAEKAGVGGYSRTVNVSTFVGAFPMDRPRYVILVMLDAPHATAETGGQTTAAFTAAPVVRAVIERTGSLLGIIPEAGRDINLAGMRELVQGAEGD